MPDCFTFWFLVEQDRDVNSVLLLLVPMSCSHLKWDIAHTSSVICLQGKHEFVNCPIHTSLFYYFVWRLGVSNVVEIHPFSVKYRQNTFQSHIKSLFNYLFLGIIHIAALLLSCELLRIFHPFQFIKSPKFSIGVINKYARPWIEVGW